MKITTWASLSLTVICGALIATGCSKSGGFSASSTTPRLEVSTDSSYLESEYALADASGKITAYQDLFFRFRIPDSQGGASYSITGAPAWLSVDQGAGELIGTPVLSQETSSLSIQITTGGNTKTLGPYSISVIGDAFKNQQWHLSNTGQRTYANLAATAGEDMNLSQTIRDRILGKGIKIAISDTGILETHPKLAPNILASLSRNYSQNFANTSTWLGKSTPSTSSPSNAHGTAVAGLAAERGWQGTGGRGVAPLAQISGFLFIQAQSVLTNRGYLTTALLDQFAGAFDIFNYSWGDSQCALSEYDSTYRNKLKVGVQTLRDNKGAIYIKAAGNEYVGALSDCYDSAASSDYFLGNANFSEENTTPYTILVGAVGPTGKSASYSSPGSNLWIAAPGGEFGWNTSSGDTYRRYPALLTTDFTGCGSGIKTFTANYNVFDDGQSPNSKCHHTATMNGTSGAAPLVTGAAALILAANPTLTWRDVKHILATTAEQIDPTSGASAHPSTGGALAGHTYEQGWITNAAGYKFHNWYGFGRVDVDAAVAMAKNYTSSWSAQQQTNVDTTWTYHSGTLNATVTGGNAAGLSRNLTVTQNWRVEAVQVRVSAQNCIGHLGIELTSPSGTKSILMNINSYLEDSSMSQHIFLSNAFYGEESDGVWSLRLIGGQAGCNTTLQSWQLNVIGRTP